MALVEWANLLPPDIKNTVHVDYSYLSIPDNPDEMYGDIARIRLAHDYIADVAWDDEREEYIVTLSLHFYDKKIIQNRVKDASEVVEMVTGWAVQYVRECVPYSDTEITETEEKRLNDCAR